MADLVTTLRCALRVCATLACVGLVAPSAGADGNAREAGKAEAAETRAVGLSRRVVRKRSCVPR